MIATTTMSESLELNMDRAPQYSEDTTESILVSSELSMPSSENVLVELEQSKQKVLALEKKLNEAITLIESLQVENGTLLNKIEVLEISATSKDISKGINNYNLPANHENNSPLINQELKKQITKLTNELSELKFRHELEHEERIAVIGEQEHEIRNLEEKLADTTQELNMLKLTMSTTTTQKPETNCITKDEYFKSVPEEKANCMNEWTEEFCYYPTPRFDLDSPEIQHLLYSWSSNIKRVQYMRLWLMYVALPTKQLPLQFPLGIELPNLQIEIYHGFLTLVIPLLRKQSFRNVHVYTRNSKDEFSMEIHGNADTIPQTENIVKDLRIRIVPIHSSDNC